MKIKMMFVLLVFSISIIFLVTCHDEENVELLKSHLNVAINESNRLETARLLDRLLKLGVDPQTLPIQVVHVGLGEYAGKVDVEVRWIGNKVQEFGGLDVNKRHEIHEAE